MYSNLSNFAEGVDTAFVVILSIIIFFLISLTTALIIFLYKFNAKRNKTAKQIEGSTVLEIIWIVVPVLLVLGMFYFGWVGFKPMITKAPEDSFKIKAIARMWTWQFEYPNGKRVDSLYVPQGKPVALELDALDVIHSLYIPAFRLKRDMVPGREDEMWFIANSPGRYDLFCAEYCGLEHSNMYSAVVVLPEDEFEKWYEDTTQTQVVDTENPVMAGFQITRKNGCQACHTPDGSKSVGPSYKGLFGKEEVVKQGGKEVTITVDEEYIRRSIFEPNAEIVKGYNTGLMLSYKNIISEEEVDMIIEYIKSLK